MTEPDQPSQDAAEVERRLATITNRFPDRFSPAQIEEIRARVERSIALGNTLRGMSTCPTPPASGFDPRAMSSE